MKNWLIIHSLGKAIICDTSLKRMMVNRLWLVNSGSGLVRSSFKEHRISAGHIYIIPSCTDFSVLSTDNLIITHINFFSSRILRYDSFVEFETPDPYQLAFFQMIDASAFDRTRYTCLPAFAQMLSGFLTLTETMYGLPYINNSTIARAVASIHENPAAVTATSLAKEAHLNVSYFIRQFKSVMGISPMKYILSCRLQYAQNYLIEGCSVSEAAEKSGYTSISAFSKAYKQYFGVSPSKM